MFNLTDVKNLAFELIDYLDNIGLWIILAIILIGYPLITVVVKFIIQQRKLAAACGDKKLLAVLSTPKDYKLLAELFKEQQSPEEKYFNADGAGKCMTISAIDQWCEDEPDNADAWLCKGARYITWAWSARGYGPGSSVSDDDAELFFERLEISWECLCEATKLNTIDPTPWAFMLIICKCHSEYREYRDDVFANAIDRDPENWPAHINMVIALTKKWGGEHEDMLDFAHSVSKNARDGSDIPLVLVRAYMEYRMYEVAFCDNEQGAQEFLNRADIRQNIDEAYQRSIAHKDYKMHKSSVYLQHHLTAWYWLTKERDKLQFIFRSLDHKMYDLHWDLMGTDDELDDAKEFAGVF